MWRRETLGGLAMLLAGRMPTRGETLLLPSDIEFEIVDADPRRTKRIIRLLSKLRKKSIISPQLFRTTYHKTPTEVFFGYEAFSITACAAVALRI
jgi:hypothetical protein